MSKPATLQLLQQSDSVSLYSILFEGDTETEFEKFMLSFMANATYNRDYQKIIAAIQKVLEVGVLERYFRPESRMSDGVCALPIESGGLRLYCLRISDEIIIIGNGGIKSTETYNEDNSLNGYVITLSAFDRLIKYNMRRRVITIEKKELVGIDNITFNV